MVPFVMVSLLLPRGKRARLPQAAVMGNSVRRSNAINHCGLRAARAQPDCHGADSGDGALIYYEGVATATFLDGFVDMLYQIMFGMVLMCPPASWFMRTFVLPKPGEGPSQSAMDAVGCAREPLRR
jgi:hypothetical protein